MTPRLLLVLSENWTMTSPRDLRALVRIAAATERLRLVAGAVIAPLRPRPGRQNVEPGATLLC